jgi:hypothetical protein
LTTRKQRIASVLKRFQFIDLARAVALQGKLREDFLRMYVDRPRGAFPSYEPFRRSVKGIYDVEMPLLGAKKASRSDIAEAVRRECRGKDEDLNLDASLCLFDFLEEFDQRAFDHPARTLPLGTDRKCAFRLSHYLVRNDVAIFQFPYPRKSRLDDHTLQVMLSLIHYAYALDDFAEAAVEIVDLSCDPVANAGRSKDAPPLRNPRLVELSPAGVMERAELENNVQDIYRVLMEISEN